MSLQRDRTAFLSWDEAEGKGGLGRAMQWLADMADEPLQLTPARGLLPWTGHWGGHLLFSLLLPFVLWRRLRREGVTQLVLPVGPGGVLLLRRPPECRLIVVCYHTYLQQAQYVPGQRWKRIFCVLERRTLRMADEIICFADDTAAVLRNEYGCASVRLIPQRFDMDAWGQSDEQESANPAPLCLCIARLEQRKGVQVLLDAWENVQQSCPAARLCIVGDGIQAGHIDRRLAELTNAWRIPGGLARGELAALVRQASILVCPSYLEGFGLTAAEAMAAGTPVVATDVPGLRSLVHDGETGLLVSPGNAQALAGAIQRLLNAPELRRSLARGGRRFIRQACDPHRARQCFRQVLSTV